MKASDMLEDLQVSIERPLTKEAIDELICSSEDYLLRQAETVADAVKNSAGEVVVLVDGPSCAGKSGFAALLANCLSKREVLSRVISLTSFLKNETEYRDECKKRGLKVNYALLEALYLDELEECMSLIHQGETALLPVYDRKWATRRELIPFTKREGQVLIIEGSGVNDGRIRSFLTADSRVISLKVDLLRAYCSNAGWFSSSDLRFARRFVRDGLLYGRGVERIYADLELERMQARKSGGESEVSFDFTIDTTLGYEPLILKNELHKILGSVKSESRYYLSSTKFLSRLDTVPELDRSFLPEGSIYKTFI